MHTDVIDFGAAHMFCSDYRQHGGRALDRGALQVMFDCPQASEFFATTCASGPALLEL